MEICPLHCCFVIFFTKCFCVGVTNNVPYIVLGDYNWQSFRLLISLMVVCNKIAPYIKWLMKMAGICRQNVQYDISRLVLSTYPIERLCLSSNNKIESFPLSGAYAKKCSSTYCLDIAEFDQSVWETVTSAPWNFSAINSWPQQTQRLEGKLYTLHCHIHWLKSKMISVP